MANDEILTAIRGIDGVASADLTGGLNLRASMGSIPPLLDDINADLRLNSTASGLLTSLAITAFDEGALEERKAEEESAKAAQTTQRRGEAKVGRNQPCPCGSGKKYKLCHGRPGVAADA